MSTPGFLETNLGLAYPFADGSMDPLIYGVADALVVANQGGPYVLETFVPNWDPLAADPLEAAVVAISGAQGVFITVTSAVSTALGNGYYSLEVLGTGATRARFIVYGPTMAVLGGLLGPLEFVSSVGSELLSGVSSIQGISGDLILAFPDYATVTESSTLAATLAFADPAARVTCPEVPDVFALGALTADSSGSATIQAGPCYKVIPSADPGSPNVLTITNICAPCTDCDDILTLQQKLTSQANYFYNLSAIYHNHFNRYQVAVAAANKTIGAVNSGADIVSPTGPITFVGRVINRPYFTQLYLAVVNNSEYAITVDLTVTIDPPELASQLVIQPESLLIQETLSTGVGFADSVGYSGFPGRTVFGVSPQDSVGYNSECKRMKMGSVTTGHWNMTAMVVFSTGPGTLPAVQTVTRTFTPAIALTGSPLVVI